jgi:PAS domain S-box-containing protein
MAAHRTASRPRRVAAQANARTGEAALAGQAERFRQVVEAAPSAMVMIDAGGSIELVNVEAERLFGYGRAELLAQPVEMLVPERFRSAHPGLRTAFFAAPRARRMGAGRDLYGLKKDGSEFPVEIGLNPIETDDGSMVLAAIVDISARKRMEERFRQVVEAAPSAMVMIDAGGKIELVNVEAERLFGYERAELLAQPVEMLVPTRFRSAHPGLRTAFFAAPKARRMGAGRDLYGLRKDGSEFPVEIGLNPIETDDGSMVLAAIVDISARKRMEERFRQVEAAPSATVMVDAGGKIELVNAEAERLFGYGRAELLAQPVEMLVPARFRSAHPGLRTAFFADPKVRRMGAGRDLYGLKKDGSEFPVEIGLNPIETDDGMMVLAAIVDISERLRTEQRLKEQSEELLRSNNELEQFAYIASHDLKAPLRAIKSLAEWIAEDIAATCSKETHDNLALLQARTERLEDLLSGLLEYSRVGISKADPEKVDTGRLVAEIIEYLAPPPAFVVECRGFMPILRAAKTPLEHVFQNLISNALKHHDRDRGTVVLSARDLGTLVEFTVRDDGPGIDPAFHERIFGMFQTLKPRDEVEGSGVGLAIVKKAVEKNGGSIKVESAPPRRGTAFVFTWRKSAE